MKNLLNLISNEEKQRILEMHNPNRKKNNLHEQPTSRLKNLLGFSDNVIKSLGDDVSKTLDVALSKPQNLITKNNQTFLKSASGTEIPLSTIQTLVKQLESGQVNFEQVQNYLPRQLSDGSDFRSVMSNIKSAKTTAAVATNAIKSGTQISSKFFDPTKINWNNVTNAKDIDTYNKIIAKAISIGDYSAISRGGFENYGITNFREFLKNNVDLGKQMYADPKTGTWYFAVK